jgi:hypothetical protein
MDQGETRTMGDRLLDAAMDPTPRAHQSRVAWLLGLAAEARTHATALRLLREAQGSIEVWRDQVLLEAARSPRP